MKGGIALLMVLLMGQLSFAVPNICEQIFDQPGGGEYLPFPLVGDEFAGNSWTVAGVYVPQVDVTLEFQHLMGAEYFIEMSDSWSGEIGRGVAVLSDKTLSGFIEYDGAYHYVDIGAYSDQGSTKIFVRIDDRCFEAEKLSPSLL